mgnify:FL=1
MQYNEKCPICGTVNRNLNLEETNGWFECENCKQKVNTLRVVKHVVKIPLYRLPTGMPKSI